MKKRALFGGSFDPFHLGHLGMISLLKEAALVDCVQVMPCKQSPHKLDKKYTASEHRLAMAELALADGEIKGFAKVDDYELQQAEVSYTYKTLDFLNESYPDDEIVLVVGADQWASFDRWVKNNQILENHSLIVFGRHGQEMVKHPRVSYLEYGNPASATMIREGRKWEEMLTPSVIGYIKKNGLYGA